MLYTRSGGAAVIELRGKNWEIRTMSGARITSDGRQENVSVPVLALPAREEPDGQQPDWPDPAGP